MNTRALLHCDDTALHSAAITARGTCLTRGTSNPRLVVRSRPASTPENAHESVGKRRRVLAREVTVLRPLADAAIRRAPNRRVAPLVRWLIGVGLVSVEHGVASARSQRRTQDEGRRERRALCRVGGGSRRCAFGRAAFGFERFSSSSVAGLERCRRRKWGRCGTPGGVPAKDNAIRVGGRTAKSPSRQGRREMNGLDLSGAGALAAWRRFSLAS